MLLNKRCIVSFSSYSPTAVLATKSRTFDPSFSSCSDISLHNYKNNTTSTTDQDLRFNTVLWCESPSYSFLSTGQENGTFQIFKHQNNTLSPYYTNNTHLTGDITGMSYNHSKHLLSIGGSSSKIILYDINTPDKPFLAPQIKPDTFHISSLSFNPKVSHILCAGTTTGNIIVLDLRQKKEVLRISHPHLTHISQILWHPLSTTSILASSSSSILSFDLSTDTTTTLVTSKEQLNSFTIYNCSKDSTLLLYTTPTSITTLPLHTSNTTHDSPTTTPHNNISDLQLSTYTPCLSSISYTDGKTLLTNILNIHNTPYITPYNNSTLTVTSYKLYCLSKNNNKYYTAYTLPRVSMSVDIDKDTILYRIYSIMSSSGDMDREVRRKIGDLIFSEYSSKDKDGGVSDKDYNLKGLNNNTDKQQGVNNSSNISFNLKDEITLSLLRGDFIKAYDLSLVSTEQQPLLYTILLCMNKELIKEKVEELRKKSKNDKIHLLLCVLCNEYSYVVNKVWLEQWYVVVYLLCYIDISYKEFGELLTVLGDRLSRYEGVNDKDSSIRGANDKDSSITDVNNKGCSIRGVDDKGSSIRGANDKDSCIKDVNNKGCSIRGVDDKGSSIRGANDSSVKQQGDNSVSSEEQGVNDNSNKQQGDNSVSSEEQGVYDSSDKQHPVNSLSTSQCNPYTYQSLICYLLSGNLKKYFDVRNSEFEIPKSVFNVIETLKKYGSVVGECYTMGGVNDSILMREFSKYNKVSIKGNDKNMKGVSDTGSKLKGVSDNSIKGGVDKGSIIKDVSNVSYTQHPVNNTPVTQHPFNNTPLTQPVINTPSIPKPVSRQSKPPLNTTPLVSKSMTRQYTTPTIPNTSINSPPKQYLQPPNIPSNINTPTLSKPQTYGQLRNSKTYGQTSNKVTPPIKSPETVPLNNIMNVPNTVLRPTGYTKPLDSSTASIMGVGQPTGYTKPLQRTPVPPTVPPAYNKPVVYNKPVSPVNPPITNITHSPTTNVDTPSNLGEVVDCINKRVELIKRLACKKKGLIYKNKINECLRRVECYENMDKSNLPLDILTRLKGVLELVSEEEVLVCEKERRLCDLKDVWYEKVRCVCEDIVRCYGGVKGIDVWVLGIVGLLQVGLSDKG